LIASNSGRTHGFTMFGPAVPQETRWLDVLAKAGFVRFELGSDPRLALAEPLRELAAIHGRDFVGEARAAVRDAHGLASVAKPAAASSEGPPIGTRHDAPSGAPSTDFAGFPFHRPANCSALDRYGRLMDLSYGDASGRLEAALFGAESGSTVAAS
jgi:hypothetical protein